MAARIIVGGRFDYMRTVWSEMAKRGKIIYFDDQMLLSANSLMNRLRRRVDHVLRQNDRWSRVKENWREFFPIDSLSKRDDNVFIIYEMNLMSTDLDAIKEIKRNLPKSRFVLFFTNTIGSVRPDTTASLLTNRDLFDIIYTFDYSDSLKYKISHWGGDFPYNATPTPPDDYYRTDLFFCGKDKGRREAIVEIFNHFNGLGINCRFIILADDASTVPDSETLPKGLEIRSEYFSYAEVSRYLQNANCLLEVSTSPSTTLRYSEAIAYGRKLITNASDAVHDQLYNPKQIKVFSDYRDIDKDFILSPLSPTDRIDPSLISVEAFTREVLRRLNLL